MIDKEPNPEHISSGKTTQTTNILNLQAAIKMGEYDPEYLASFPEWEDLTPNMQYEFVREGIENKRQHLRQQYARTWNSPGFSKKPHLEEAIKNIFNRLKKLQADEERLSLHYSRLI